MPTDTIYGVVALASNREAVARLYRLRRNARRKPFIILIENARSLREFGIIISARQKEFLKKCWPGKVSIIFRCPSTRFNYLHLGTKTLAFRVPKNGKLLSFLKKTGPLVAPSANPEGKKPSETISEARRYFGNQVDRYVSAGRRLCGKPSTLVSFVGDKPIIIRQGAVRVAR